MTQLDPVWRCSPHLDICVGASAKCGSRSVLLGLAQLCYPEREYTYETLKHHTMKDDPRLKKVLESKVEALYPDTLRVGIIRNPLDRFRSLCAHQAEGKPGLPKNVKGKPIQHMVNLIQRSGPRTNAHWHLQAPLLRRATLIIPFEEFPAWWYQHWDVELPFVNQGKSDIRLTPKHEEWVRQHYADDLAIYEGARINHDRT